VRILALDVGEKRIGLAVSDPLGLTAQGLEVLTRQNPEADLARLVQVARHWGVQQIVLGLPRHLDGRLGTLALQVLELADALQKTLGVEVVTWEERLTTKEAERVLLQADLSRRRRRRVLDQLAAVLILQNYLDYRQQQG
jgi:putative Holliday junction resolvase